MTEKTEFFASDNYSGICPEAVDYLIKSNSGHEISYGDDKWTDEACNLFREIFETDCEVFFVFNGTAANGLALATLCQSYHSVICHEFAHIETDECGAPEFFSHGTKLLLGNGDNGKLTPQNIEYLVNKRTDIHYPKPKALSITQATELGRVYTIKELKELKAAAEKYSLKIHMDGARFANAVASLGCKPKDITVDCGVDVLSFGGSKNGISHGEAVVFFNKGLAEEFAYRCKQAGQLASKMRFISAQWVGMLKNDVWLKYAKHSNKCAAILEEKLKRINKVEIMFPREANSVFVKMPPDVIEKLHKKGWHFYTFIGVGGARFMCTWNTKEETINEFVRDVQNFISE